MSEKGITSAARQSSCRSRKCSSCPLCQGEKIRCTPEICRICNESHIEGFKKGVKHQRENSIERELVELFDKKYGRDEAVRLDKLNEELLELNREVLLYFSNNDINNIEDICDEMSDVVAVIAHLCSIFGTDLNKLLKQSYNKVKGREKDPNYLRKHPHV